MNRIDTPGVDKPAFIVNVVSTYNLGCRLNLTKIAKEMRHLFPVKFNPTKFAAMTFNIEAPGLGRTTALVFASGSVVHTGAVTEEHSRLSAHTFVRFLNEVLHIPAVVCNFTITNIVCDFKTGFEVDLKGVKTELGSRAKYKPKKFPACRVKAPDGSKKVCEDLHSFDMSNDPFHVNLKSLSCYILSFDCQMTIFSLMLRSKKLTDMFWNRWRCSTSLAGPC
jgi:TATA-box binding protein (TBP) (component of TFIID and TFIIIB)